MNTISVFIVQLVAYLTFTFAGHHIRPLLEFIDEGENTFIGKAAPEFSLVDLKGESYQLSSFRGHFLVIHIATTWCPFCNAEAPHLEELYQQYKNKNVKVLIIDVKESRELVQTKLQDRFNFTFPLLLDSDGSVAASYAPPGVLPDLARDEVMLASNLLIDPEGNIQFLSLLDSKNFDAKLIDLKTRLDELLGIE
jgi:peroxiredoxin